MANGKIALAPDIKKINETVTKKIFGKQKPEDIKLRDMYPPTAYAIGLHSLKIVYFVWPVFLFANHLILGILKGVTGGLEKGLQEALKAYRKKW